MVTYANGKIPTSAMSALSVGGALLPAAAGNFELWRALAADAGWPLTITSAADAFRTYAVQERIFRDRYTTTRLPGRPTKVWNGTTWYLLPGQATAAVPGTSNHGKGLAVDVKNAGAFTGPFYKWMAATGPALGWTNTEGRSINEPWHWANDNRPRGALAGVVDALPTSEEDDMSAAEVAQIRADIDTVHRAVLASNAKADVGTVADELRAAAVVVGQTRADVGTVAGEVRATRADVGTVANELRAAQATINALAGLLAKGPTGNGLTTAQIKSTAQDAIRDVLGSLND